MPGFGGDWREPDWEDAGRVHDWRNYISPRVKELWPTLSEELKEVLAEQAELQAGREEWD